MDDGSLRAILGVIHLVRETPSRTQSRPSKIVISYLQETEDVCRKMLGDGDHWRLNDQFVNLSMTNPSRYPLAGSIGSRLKA
jgi:hypothetical protein